MRILLLTNDETLSSAVQSWLLSAGHECRSLRQPPSATDVAWQPDAMLVDGSLGLGATVDALERLRQPGSHRPVLHVGSPESAAPGAVQADLALGPDALAALLLTLARPTEADPPPLSRLAGELSIDLARRSVQLNGVPVELTPTEWQVIALLAAEPQRAVPRALVAQLIGDGREASANAVAVHLYNLRRKLGRHAIETIRGRGFRLRP